jgi:hypothetical protein
MRWGLCASTVPRQGEAQPVRRPGHAPALGLGDHDRLHDRAPPVQVEPGRTS